MTENPESQVSESQIAVHWREEEYYPPPALRRAGQRERTRPSSTGSARSKFPDCFTRVRRPADLGQALAHHAGHAATRRSGNGSSAASSTPATTASTGTLEASANKTAIIWVPEPESDEPVAITYRRAATAGSTSSPRCCATSPGVKTGDRVTLHMPMVPELPVIDAGLRAARRHPLPGVRRVQRQRLRHPDRRLRQPDPDHDGRLLPQRRPDRPQGQGRRGGGRGGQAGPGGRQGTGLAAPPRPVRVADADGRGPGLLRRRADRRLPRPAGRAGVACRPRRRCSSCTPAARPAGRRAPSTAPAATCPTSPARPSTTRTSTRTTCTGAWPTSAGSPATPTSSTGRWRSARPRSSTRACRTTPTPAGPGGSPSGSGVNIFHTSPTAIRMLRKVGPDEPAKYDYHFKHMTTVGEPIEPEVWRWYHEVGRQGRGRDRRHLVADRDRRLPRHHAARASIR